jgi:hypothetical protein
MGLKLSQAKLSRFFTNLLVLTSAAWVGFKLAGKMKKELKAYLTICLSSFFEGVTITAPVRIENVFRTPAD